MPESRSLAIGRETLSLITARVRDLPMSPPCYVGGALDLVSVCRQLALKGLDSALVRDGERLGMFTTADLRDALLLAQTPAALAVRDVTSFDLVVVHPDSRVIEALWLMERRRVPRLLVRDGATVIGTLGHLDLLGFVANLSHLVVLRIDQAASLDELLAAATRVDAMVAQLYKDGAKIERIAQLVGESNSCLFARLWSFVAPPDLQANSCLVVMGSEGRGEQIVKTDQDNGLLLRDGYTCNSITTVAAAFNTALSRFGYPACAGGIMLTNALWRQSVGDFRRTLRRWLFGGEAQGVMNLAIFLDARAVAGDAGLLLQARRFLNDSVVDNDAFFARFARAAVQFDEAGGWWNRLFSGRGRDAAPFDLKKLGTFPIVHGVRALALQHRLEAVNTAQRLQELAQRGVLTATLSQDLSDALRVLMGLKMKTNLRQRELGLPLDNLVRLADLTTLERDMLEHCLAITRVFRRYLHRHFKLDAL